MRWRAVADTAWTFWILYVREHGDVMMVMSMMGPTDESLHPPGRTYGATAPAPANDAHALRRVVHGRCCSHVCGSFTSRLVECLLQFLVVNIALAVVRYACMLVLVPEPVPVLECLCLCLCLGGVAAHLP